MVRFAVVGEDTGKIGLVEPLPGETLEDFFRRDTARPDAYWGSWFWDPDQRQDARVVPVDPAGAVFGPVPGRILRALGLTLPGGGLEPAVWVEIDTQG